MSRLVYADEPHPRLRLKRPRPPRTIHLEELRRLRLREADANRGRRARDPAARGPGPRDRDAAARDLATRDLATRDPGPRDRDAAARDLATRGSDPAARGPEAHRHTRDPGRRDLGARDPELGRRDSGRPVPGRRDRGAYGRVGTGAAGPARSLRAAGRGRRRPLVALARSLRAVGLARAVAIVLSVAGLTLLGDAALTLVWKEPVSSLYAQIRQDELKGDLGALERALPSPLEVTALAHLRTEPARVAYLARTLRDSARPGAAVGRIRIPRIGLDMVVVNGTDLADLREGPGFYEQTGFPGVGAVTAIAGHRTTYLAPFRHIDELRPGDEISVDMPYGRFVYRVTGHRVVKPTDVGVLEPIGHVRLVLSACTPLFSAAERLIVFARLERVDPLGAARAA